MLAEGAGNCDTFKPVQGLEIPMYRDRLQNPGGPSVNRLTLEHADVMVGIEKDCRTCAMSLMETLSRQLLCDLPEDIGPTRMCFRSSGRNDPTGRGIKTRGGEIK